METVEEECGTVISSSFILCHEKMKNEK